MMRKALATIAVSGCMLLVMKGAGAGDGAVRAESAVPVYKDPGQPLERRVADLVSRMTLEEKVAQTWCLWSSAQALIDSAGAFDEVGAARMLGNGIGHIARMCWGYGPRQGAERTNTIQRWVMENTRLGIPVIFHGEGLHGFQAEGATQFPTAIALASTWDPELHHDIFTVVAREMRARGVSQVFTPVLGLGREPRWGRIEETYGEDAYLISRMGVACVRGFQGTGPFIDNAHVIATVKHFAVYSQPERGINYSPGNFSERIIRDQFLPPFHAAITEGGALGVMPSYNEIDGVPAHGNRKYLHDILRGEWGFDGLIVSDYSGIDHLVSKHHVAAGKKEAARLALSAGVDVELPDIDCYGTLAAQVRDGLVSEAMLDRSVERMLRMKFLLGLFDDPYVDPDRAVRVTNTREHRELALRAAHKAAVLLKNEGGLLPFERSRLKRLAVIGPNAVHPHLGCYSWEPHVGVGVLEGITDKVGDDIEIRYAEGCRITENTPSWMDYEVILADPEENRMRIREAVKVAKDCDAVVLVVGGNESTCREAWANDHPGDRSGLDLIGEQDELVRAILGTGVPTAVVLINGRPLSINHIAENAPAVLECWYLGQSAGTAVADILFGDVNPGGRLPVTFPRSVGHLPVYYNHKPSITQDYLDADAGPLFPFGWGLSYTTFRYDNLRITPDVIGPAGTAAVSVDITNTGDRTGDEVAQMYIRDDVSSVTRPVKELRGFRRITLDPGETRTVTFDITPDKLAFTGLHMERIVEPGGFTVMVGANSIDVQSAALTVR